MSVKFLWVALTLTVWLHVAIHYAANVVWLMSAHY
jgi:hypothetical protein